MRTTGPVLEFAAGYWSSVTLHEICAGQNRFLLTLEPSDHWIHKLSSLSKNGHEIRKVNPGWAECSIPEPPAGFRRWGLACLDHVPQEARIRHTLEARERVDVVLVHSAREPKVQEAVETYKYVAWFDHLMPWPSAICSDTVDVGEWGLFASPRIDPHLFFDRVYVLNLARRKDRWKAFEEQFHQCGWPFQDPVRFVAIDGRQCNPPGWWTQGPGAWGCAISHIRILEDAIQGNHERIVVFEDDVEFPEGWLERLGKFLEALPTDWGQIYFGGQLIRPEEHPPERVNEHIVRPWNVNRTHGYAVHRRYMVDLYKHLCDWPAWSKIPRHHVDHRMGVAAEQKLGNVYAPSDGWIVGQTADKSDVCETDLRERYWDHGFPDDAAEDRPFVVVLGIHRSGSSMVAGILHELGVHMGNKFQGYEDRHKGSFEAVGLRDLCERLYPFPSIEPAIPMTEAERWLATWVGHRRQEAKGQRTLPGGKYPHLCAMGGLLRKVEPLRIVHINRPLEVSIKSLVGRGVNPEKAKKVQTWLWWEKGKFLTTLKEEERLDLEYDQVLKAPAEVVDQITEFLQLGVRKNRRQKAIEMVDASLRTH
jgi:hypothetical protein